MDIAAYLARKEKRTKARANEGVDGSGIRWLGEVMQGKLSVEQGQREQRMRMERERRSVCFPEGDAGGRAGSGEERDRGRDAAGAGAEA